MKLNFKGNSAVVTGASGGMGLEISKQLSKNNISVLMLDLQSPKKDFLKKFNILIFCVKHLEFYKLIDFKKIINLKKTIFDLNHVIPKKYIKSRYSKNLYILGE